MCGLKRTQTKNAGYVTVFTVLFLLAFSSFVFFMLELVYWRLGNMKAGEAVGQNVKSLFGDFDAHLYEDYHLLMIDAFYGTESKAYLEERLSEQLSLNLSGGGSLFRLRLEDLYVSSQSGFMDEDYAALKKQIHDYCGYAMTEEILDMLKRRNENGQEETGSTGGAGGAEMPEEIVLPGEEHIQDPRSYISSLTGEALLRLVCPKNVQPSANPVDLSGLPSKEKGVMEDGESMPEHMWADSVIDRMLKGEVFDIGSLQAPLERLELVFYISSAFKSCLKTEERGVFQGEQEYILYGKNSDQKNLLYAVNEIIWLRMPFNYLYLKGSAGKQAVIRSAAAVLAVLCEASPEFMNKLLTGIVCLGESVLDVKALLHGEPVALKKTDATWKLSLSDLFLNKLKGNGKTDVKKGLFYEDYLMLLMIKKISADGMYARLLDVITLNMQRMQPTFSVKHGITKATVSYRLECDARFSAFPRQQNPAAYCFFFERSLEY